MMKIPYIAPQQGPAAVKKAQDLVEKMQGLVQELTRAGSRPDNRYALLGRAERAKLLVELGYPKMLVGSVAFFTERVRVPRGEGLAEQDQLMVGFTSDAFDPDLYADPAIKTALIESHRGRCAYCESLINQVNYGDVEHFRPKAAYADQGSPTLFRPAYYFLAYDPRNLFYACQLCNEAYKGNVFPVIGSRYPDVAIDAEQPVLIDCYTEDPRAFIRFNPMNACAYPFDLVHAFYAETQGWSLQQTALELWKDPTKIPGQHDHQGLPLSNPEVDRAFQGWLPGQRNPVLGRGARTISILHLNRRALVRARASQLRQLRGMVWASSAAGPDQVAAQQLLAALVGDDPGRATLAPEYLSLSIDAVQTWANAGASAFAWIDAYNGILAAFVPKREVLAELPHSDALMYLVLERELRDAGTRRIVYISGSDELYGNPEGQRGVALAIDWSEELENTVLVKRGGKVTQEMKLRELVVFLDGNKSGWNLFKKSEVWAVGNYPPLRI